MINSVTINNLRGIRTGSLGGLTGLTVLIGPNGSGKSTVLDALSIGVSATPALAVGESVRRRLSRQSTAKWLFPAQSAGATSILVPFGSFHRRTVLEWTGNGVRVAVSREGPVTGSVGAGSVEFGSRDEFSVKWQDERHLATVQVEHRFIDMRFGALDAPDLVDVLTAAKAEGRAGKARELLKEIVPSLETLEILKLGEGFGVAIVNERSAVPLAVSGDGVRGLARLCLELAAHRGGLVLVEEPEVHQHPRSLRMSAQAIVGAVKRDVQVVLATHSLELIDDLLECAKAESLLDSVSVQRLRLDDGTLDVRRFSGAEAAEARFELEAELR